MTAHSAYIKMLIAKSHFVANAMWHLIWQVRHRAQHVLDLSADTFPSRLSDFIPSKGLDLQRPKER